MMKNRTPLVSILIPLYNSEAYIEQTLISCLNQSYKNIEIIVVDDGSTDRSVQIVNRYISYNSKIKLFTQDHQGACAARNLAFKHSKGEYIQYLDSDDLISRDKVYNQILLIEREDDLTLVSCGWVHFINDVTKTLYKKNWTFRSYDYPVDFLIDSWSGKGSSQTSCWLTSRKLIKKAGDWDISLLKNQDGDFFCRVILNSTIMKFCNNSFVYYRLTGHSSISASMSYESCESTLISLGNYQKYLGHLINNQNIRKALAINLSSFYRYYYPLYPDLLLKAKTEISKLGFESFIIPKKYPLRYFALMFGFENTVKIEKKTKKAIKSLF